MLTGPSLDTSLRDAPHQGGAALHCGFQVLRKSLLGVIAPAARAPAPGEKPGRETPAPVHEDKRKKPEAEHDPPWSPHAPWPAGGGPGGNRTHVLAD